MDYEYEFYEAEPTEITKFIADEFKKDHYEHTKLNRKQYAYSVRHKGEIIAAGRGSCFGTDCNISEIIIAEEYRNKGLGKEILDRIEALGKKSGCTRMLVDTYEYQAPNFYLNNGFTEKGRIENYRQEHARIFFEKTIKL